MQSGYKIANGLFQSRISYEITLVFCRHPHFAYKRESGFLCRDVAAGSSSSEATRRIRQYNSGSRRPFPRDGDKRGERCGEAQIFPPSEREDIKGQSLAEEGRDELISLTTVASRDAGTTGDPNASSSLREAQARETKHKNFCRLFSQPPGPHFPVLFSRVDMLKSYKGLPLTGAKSNGEVVCLANSYVVFAMLLFAIDSGR